MPRSRREQEAGTDRAFVTGKVYNHFKRMEKRAVLDGVAAELRRMIGEPVQRHRLN